MYTVWGFKILFDKIVEEKLVVNVGIVLNRNVFEVIVVEANDVSVVKEVTVEVTEEDESNVNVVDNNDSLLVVVVIENVALLVVGNELRKLFSRLELDELVP